MNTGLYHRRHDHPEILRALLASGMTQAEVARAVKMHQPTICRWANGAAPDSADRALALQALLVSRRPAPEVSV